MNLYICWRKNYSLLQFSFPILGFNTCIQSFILFKFNVVGVNPYLSKLKVEKMMKNGLRKTKKLYLHLIKKHPWTQEIQLSCLEIKTKLHFCILRMFSFVVPRYEITRIVYAFVWQDIFLMICGINICPLKD